MSQSNDQVLNGWFSLRHLAVRGRGVGRITGFGPIIVSIWEDLHALHDTERTVSSFVVGGVWASDAIEG